jgi:ABC-type lipoprotein release transport system permease subunit
MALARFITIAYRDLARNKRRTGLTALAIGLGLVVTMAMSSMIDGMVANSLADNIRLSTGHLQIRNESYDVDKGSLLSKDLIKEPEMIASQVESLEGVQSAAPVLWIGGLMSTSQESLGIEVVGIDPDDVFHDPVRKGITAGEYLKNDDRGLILIGRMLAEEMDISVGRRVSLAINDANGVGQEGVFTVAGLVDTGFPSIDQNRVILPLAQAQSFSGVGNRASSIILTLDDREAAANVAAKLQSPEAQIVTWEELNALLLDSMEYGIYFYYILYAVIFLLVAVLVVNTLLMSVFERTREIGILAALGMNRRQILQLFLLQGVVQALIGIAIGLALGTGIVALMTYVGISIPAQTASMVQGMAVGTKMYGGFAWEQFAALALLLLVIVTLVSLYPARLASRMEPVEALRTAK